MSKSDKIIDYLDSVLQHLEKRSQSKSKKPARTEQLKLWNETGDGIEPK